jgi:ketosteroid isomerase-like protein
MADSNRARYCTSMARVDLDRFRAAYTRSTEALRAGDIDAAFGWVPGEFEWHVLAESVAGDAPPDAPPVLHGRDEVVAWFGKTQEEWGWRPEAQDFDDPGDGTIVVHAKGVLHGRATGLRSEVRFSQVWEFDDHGVPVRVRERLDDYWLEGTRGADAGP